MADPDRRKNAVDAIADWHYKLHPHPDGYDGNRAARARLRRCAIALDALTERETSLLLGSLRAAGLEPYYDDRVVLLAILLARVKPTNGGNRFAEILGGDAQQVMRPLRFNGLMKAMLSGEFSLQLRVLRRAIELVRKKPPFNSRAFIEDILFFNDKTARNWALDYWHTPRSLEQSEAESPAVSEEA